MASSFHWCSTCHSRYRGHFSVHASTAKHRHNLHPKLGDRRDVRKALGYATVNVRRALAGYQGEDHQKVRAHRRRRPLDGPRREVKVRRYFRQPGFGWITHLSASGVERRIRASLR